MASGRVLEAPADRPPGQRGWRAVFLPSLAGFVLDALDPDLARLTPWSTTCRRCSASSSSPTGTS